QGDPKATSVTEVDFDCTWFSPCLPLSLSPCLLAVRLYGSVTTSPLAIVAMAANWSMSMLVLSGRTEPSAKAKLMTPEWKLAQARLQGLLPPTEVLLKESHLS